MGKRKQHNNDAGYIAERMNPYAHGTKVVIYYADQQGLDTGGNKYAIVCTAHGTIVGDTSLPRSRSSMKDPANFCEDCRELKDQLRLHQNAEPVTN